MTTKTKNTRDQSSAQIVPGIKFVNLLIENFRCFDELKIDSLGQINLIGGKNNVGKTTLLEAIFLLLGTTNISLVLKLNAFRGLETNEGDYTSLREALWYHLFHNYDHNLIPKIQARLQTGKATSIEIRQNREQRNEVLHQVRKVQSSGATSQDVIFQEALSFTYRDTRGREWPSTMMDITPNGISFQRPAIEPPFPGIMLASRRKSTNTETTSRFGQMETTGHENDLLDALKIVEPRLKKISTIVAGGVAQLHGDIGIGRMIPLSIMGDGLGSLSSLLLAIASAPKGVVLVDEIENGYHYSVLTDIWKAISKIARIYETQIFATTHSWECIKAAHNNFKINDDQRFKYIRLQKTNEKIEPVSFDIDSLQTMIDEEWEVR